MLSPQQKQNVAEWLYHLESGKYKQGMYQLKGGGKYCCLGVAAEAVLGREFNIMGEYAANGKLGFSGLVKEDEERLGLNQLVTAEESLTIGKNHGAASTRGLPRQSVCITLNDRHGLSFTEIAKFIREMGWDNH